MGAARPALDALAAVDPGRALHYRALPQSPFLDLLAAE
jgi:hypothetical protein